MSPRWIRNSLRSIGIAVFLGLALPATSSAQSFGSPVPAGSPFSLGFGDCAGCCQTHHCPPAFKHCMEGPPRIHFRHGCPRPVCDPCNLPHYGYFDTCWIPWPHGANFGHCPVPPPAAMVTLNNPPMQIAPGAPRTPATTMPPGTVTPMPSINSPEELPLPRRFDK